jgi:putative membrane protein
MKRMGLLVLALAVAVTVGCHRSNTTSNSANGTPGAAGTSGSAVPRADANFVRDASELNNAEIEVSRLAVDRSTNPDVKKFAQTVIDDHTAAGDKLNAIAAQNSIETAPPNPDTARDERDKLASKQGADFDRAYVDAMVDGHDTFLSKLGSRVDKRGDGNNATITPEKSDNPVTQTVNQWAAETYRAASAHRDQAKALQDTLKKTATD